MKDNQLFELLRNFIFMIIPNVKDALEKRYVKPRFEKYPSLKYRENGMPEISEYGNSPVKISELFTSFSGKPDIDIGSLPDYQNAYNYLFGLKQFKDYNFIERKNMEAADNLYRFLTRGVLVDFVERYYLLNKRDDNNEPLLKEIYLPFENFIFSEVLHFDIATPILFTTFDFDEYNINESTLIRRIPDDYNKSRYSIINYSPPITSTLVSCATHEIVLKNYYTKKKKNLFDPLFSQERIYPHDKFELFYNSLKIATNVSTGYAQVLVYPHDWVESYSMDLPYITGTSVKRYPSFFDDYFWNNQKLPQVSKSEIQDVGAFYVKLSENQNKKFKIANKRLRYSYFRDNEEDSILDIIIALETLLSDGDKGEIIHKLSLRAAKLLGDFAKDYDPIDVFKSVKKIYDFRSAIVHGSSKLDLKKEIKISNTTKPIKTIALANDYLRDIIKILILNPRFLDSKEIDKLLLK